MSRQPRQPIVTDSHGTARFQSNKIVEWLIDRSPYILNEIAANPSFSNEDRSQLAQLIGYSVSGYGDLSYAVDVDEADREAAALYPDATLGDPVPVREVTE